MFGCIYFPGSQPAQVFTVILLCTQVSAGTQGLKRMGGGCCHGGSIVLLRQVGAQEESEG